MFTSVIKIPLYVTNINNFVSAGYNMEHLQTGQNGNPLLMYFTSADWLISTDWITLNNCQWHLQLYPVLPTVYYRKVLL